MTAAGNRPEAVLGPSGAATFPHTTTFPLVHATGTSRHHRAQTRAAHSHPRDAVMGAIRIVHTTRIGRQPRALVMRTTTGEEALTATATLTGTATLAGTIHATISVVTVTTPAQECASEMNTMGGNQIHRAGTSIIAPISPCRLHRIPCRHSGPRCRAEAPEAVEEVIPHHLHRVLQTSNSGLSPFSRSLCANLQDADSYARVRRSTSGQSHRNVPTEN